MLVPIAHASNAPDNQKGFLASLCSGNKIVFVALDLPNNNKPQPSTVFPSSKCPLCNALEQEAVDITLVVKGLRFNKADDHYDLITSELRHDYLIRLSAIRAPPQFS